MVSIANIILTEGLSFQYKTSCEADNPSVSLREPPPLTQGRLSSYINPFPSLALRMNGFALRSSSRLEAVP